MLNFLVMWKLNVPNALEQHFQCVLFFKVKEPETEKHGPKRKRRRERVQETKQISRLQVSYFLWKVRILISLLMCLLMVIVRSFWTESSHHSEVASSSCHSCGGCDCSTVLWLQGSPVALRSDEWSRWSKTKKKVP